MTDQSFILNKKRPYIMALLLWPLKRKTEAPQNENLKKFTPVIAYKEIVSCLFIM